MACSLRSRHGFVNTGSDSSPAVSINWRTDQQAFDSCKLLLQRHASREQNTTRDVAMMYLDHFGLNRLPFQAKPSPGFLYLSAAHARAKAYLEYTVWNNEGLAVITGAIGSGKTTLVNHLMRRLSKNIICVKIHQTKINEKQFLQLLLAKFGIDAFGAEKAKLYTLLNTFLAEQYKRKRKILLVIDEAHHLAPEVLEEIRLLAGIEIEGQTILNCILLGHAELMDTLLAPGMEQLSQRVRLRFHLPELSETETREYIEHRLRIAGHEQPSSVFLHSTTPIIFKYTGGVPRLINTLCDTALIVAYAKNSQIVTSDLLSNAIKDLMWTPHMDSMSPDQDTLTGTSGFRMIVLEQDGNVINKISLNKSQAKIGRHTTNDIVLNDRLVSRHHAKIIVTPDGAVFEDLGSSNGSYLKESRVTRLDLKRGDTITIGSYELKYLDSPMISSSTELTDLIKLSDDSVVI